MGVVGVTAFAAALVVALVGAASARPLAEPRTDSVVFTRGERVMLMDASGANQRRAPFADYPSFSPDGRRVVYLLTRNPSSGTTQSLIVANADGSHRRTLVSKAYCLGPASWSPDSKKIAYTLDCEVDFMSIWVVDWDGRHRKQLTGRWNLDPHWSPDGRTILFTSYTRQRGWKLFLMDADRRHRREIRGRYPGVESAFYAARWSRDGRRIFFLTDDKKLFTMNRDGTHVQDLTPQGLDIGAYALSPDERLVAVHGVTRSGAARDIFVFAPGSSSATRLTNTRGPDEDPQWSRDGTKILFASDRDGNTEIYLMAADGSDQTNLTHNPALDGRPSWVPRKT